MPKLSPAKQPSENSVHQIRLETSSIAISLQVTAVFLTLVSWAAQWLRYAGGVENAYGLIPVMDVDREFSVPTVYSVLLLFTAALLLAFIAVFKIRAKAPFRWHWVILSLGFFFMAFDEGASMHELLTDPLKGALSSDLPGFLSFSWVLIGGLVALLAGLFFVRFVLSLPGRTRNRFILSGALYLSGAILMEMVGGNFADLNGIKNLGYNSLVTLEEFLEMTGSVCFIYTLLNTLREDLPVIHFQF